jgi:hypothetical protein
MDFKSLSDLEKYLQKQIKDSLKTDVKTKSEILIESHVAKDVYADVYPWEPSRYIRSFNLIESVSSEMISDDELKLYMDDNIAQSHHMYNKNEPLEPYANIVETGLGYDYDKPYSYNQPRPFFANSVEELKSGKLKEYLKDSLKKHGLNVE